MYEETMYTEQKHRKPDYPAVRPNVSTNDDRIDLTKTDTTSWPKSYIRGNIRQVLDQRIVGYISNLGQHLKPQIKFSSDSGSSDNGTNQDQKHLSSYANKTADTAPPKKPQTDDPDESEKAEDDDDDGPSDGDESGKADEDDQRVGVIYARVSGGSQTEDDDDDDDDEIDSGSIEGQIEQLREVAEKHDIRLPFNPYIDKAQTGQNFDREGIKDLFRAAKREEIDYLLVEKVDRLGRNAAQTLYFISVLQSECGVTLMTPSGERDISEIEGLMHTTMMSLMAEIQNQLRTTKATKERVRGFLKKRNWKCSSPRIPLGYSEDDDGWLTVDPDEKEIVREIFRKFTECKEYAQTKRDIEAEFGANVLDGYQIKTLLQQKAYIGKPQIPEEWLEDTSFEDNVIDEPELHLLQPESNDSVSEDTFEKAQAIIEEKDRAHKSDDEPYNLSDFIDDFGLFPTIEASPVARLIHHCGEPLIRAGQIDIGGQFDIPTHRYICPACEEEEKASDYYRKWPKQHEVEKMDLIREILVSVESAYDSVAEVAAAINNRDESETDTEETDGDDEPDSNDETDSDDE
jgi:DNA invertase Pin-like site-specific DNA recombinase